MMTKKISAVITLLLMASAPMACAKENKDGQDPSASAAARKSFTQLDANKDGYISQLEAHQQQSLEKEFNRADADGDGKLDLKEYAATQSSQQNKNL